MSNNDKQYTIYLRSAEPGKRRVPCTKQQFDDYYRDINAYRRTQMNHGRCVCPPSRWASLRYGLLYLSSSHQRRHQLPR